MLQLHGTYCENGETKPTSYNMNIMASGQVTGTAQDDDGQAQVNGTVVWDASQPVGQIAWEERGSVVLEASGTIGQMAGPGGNFFSIEANYVSNYQNTHGVTKVQSAPVAVAQATIVQGTVVGAPAQPNTVAEDNPNLAMNNMNNKIP